jgi:hypothetical protein
VATTFSAATTAADLAGRGAYTIPVWTDENRNVYLKNWQGVLNTDGAGTFQTSQFLWLNDYNAAPAVSGELRQGFQQTTRSVNPYIGSSRWDRAILRSVYDTPLVQNPMNTGQLLDWMTTGHANLPNSQLGYPQCASPPAAPVQPCFPASAVNNLRLNLRGDIFFQDGKQFTGFDVKFAYVTLAANGAFFGSSLAPMTCARDSTGAVLFNCTDGITVRNNLTVDIHLDSFGPFTDISVGTAFVFPGRYWSSCPMATWDFDVVAHFNIESCMTLDPTKTSFSYDPIANHVFVGSGPWVCTDSLGGTGQVGFGCSSTGTQNPLNDQTYTLSRYGKGQVPGAAAVGEYFRSFGTLGLYLWSGIIGDTSEDTVTFSAFFSCFGPFQPTPTLGVTSGCGHWQQGIGQAGGLGLITVTQFGILRRFLFLNWVAPQTWAAPPCSSPDVCTGATNPPDLMQALTNTATTPGPIFFEGPYTIYEASSIRIGGTTPVGCTTAYNPTSPSTSGGLDC